MKLSELMALLTRVQQVAGDADVEFGAPGAAAPAVVGDVVVHLAPGDGTVAGSVTVELEQASPPAQPAPAPDPQPAP